MMTEMNEDVSYILYPVKQEMIELLQSKKLVDSIDTF